MSKNKNVLFIINGLGNGNSIRCHRLIRDKYNDCHITIFSSGNGYEYYSKQEKFESVFSIAPLKYGSGKKEVSLIQILPESFSNLSNLIRNSLKIREEIKSNSYTEVVIDSDYTAVFWKFLFKGQITAVNNSYWIKEVPILKVLKKNELAQLTIEYFDYLFHCLVPDIVLVPNAPGLLEGKYLPSHFKLYQSREKLLLREKMDKMVLIIISGSGIGFDKKILEIISLFPEFNFEIIGINGDDKLNYKFHGFVEDTAVFLERCCLVVASAGWTTVIECIENKIPTVLLPIPGHSEQKANSYLASQHSFCKETTIGSLQTLLKNLLENMNKLNLFNG